ncbi:MAG: hypothetical protein KF799_07745 [Bdellovibrionales bacterium]|nr:hypothetical protein [Bdellovibrionales bacterium]
MLFSGKITNSFLVFLDRHGVDSEKIFELTDLPTEFLRDPSCWIPAQDAEKFIAGIDREFGSIFHESLPTLVGHQCHTLRAWGVLDSVIKMMSKPQDLFLQPHRFVSYFVSPAPPVGNVVRELESISFDLPISNQEFPFISEFIRSALEVLPVYLGRNQAQVEWRDTTIQISWSESQSDLLKEEDLSPNYKPELVQNLMQALEESQRQVEDLRNQLSRGESASSPQPIPATDTEFIQGLRAHVVRTRGHMMRLSDYLVRSQQLVTLLIGQDRLNRQVQEAMRRVDWDYVKTQSSQAAQETADLLTLFERELNQRLRSNNKSHKPELQAPIQRTLDLEAH